jgi:Fe-S cluster assembly protein SufD
MSEISEGRDHYISSFKGFEKNGGSAKSPSWLQPIRKAAISRFEEVGFPTTRHEEWKYTNVAPLTKVRFQPAALASDKLPAGRVEQVTVGESSWPRLVFVNGRYSEQLSSVRSLPEGVKAGSLSVKLASGANDLEAHLARYADYQDHAFVALNTAFMEDGAYVCIPKGVVVSEPIYLLFVSTIQKEPTVSYPRNLIVVGEGSQSAIVEGYFALEEGIYFTNAVTEIVAGPNAVIDHYKLESESYSAFHVATQQAHLDRSSNLSSHSISMGGALIRNDVNVTLGGEGAECTLNGLYVATGQEQVDNHTRIDHVMPHCSSRELYKGILSGMAKGVFNGKIYVHKNAQKTDAQQTNKNLLLSKDAWINTKPQLEIYADDVKCTHGSTIGQLDQDAIFYSRSRGIDLEAARGLLTQAFANDMVRRIKIEPMQARLDRLLAARLKNGILRGVR